MILLWGEMYYGYRHSGKTICNNARESPGCIWFPWSQGEVDYAPHGKRIDMKPLAVQEWKVISIVEGPCSLCVHSMCVHSMCGTFHLHGKVRELWVLDIALKVTAFEFCSSLP